MEAFYVCAVLTALNIASSMKTSGKVRPVFHVSLTEELAYDICADGALHSLTSAHSVRLYDKATNITTVIGANKEGVELIHNNMSASFGLYPKGGKLIVRAWNAATGVGMEIDFGTLAIHAKRIQNDIDSYICAESTHSRQARLAMLAGGSGAGCGGVQVADYPQDTRRMGVISGGGGGSYDPCNIGLIDDRTTTPPKTPFLEGLKYWAANTLRGICQGLLSPVDLPGCDPASKTVACTRVAAILQAAIWIPGDAIVWFPLCIGAVEVVCANLPPSLDPAINFSTGKICDAIGAKLTGH